MVSLASARPALIRPCSDSDEGHYADPQSQTLYNEHTLSLYHKAALNSWNKIQEPGRKKFESYTMIIQGPREPFTKITKAVQIGVRDPEVRRVLIESLTFENAHLECKKDSWSSKGQSSTNG